MRCFVAINLEEPLKKSIEASIEPLKKGNADVKWVPAVNLHITLKFLGETDESAAAGIKESLSDISNKFSPFEIALYGVGVFPDEKRPRIVWIDILGPDRLMNLQASVEDYLISYGFPKEARSFSPHLTIGRVRSPKNKDFLLRAMKPLKDKDFGNIRVDKIYLMRSDLKPAGAQYTSVAEFPLNKEE
ncbi:MAG: RNA 2',3'-cyclic phosphodiesterase [Nitrospirae bacterium]|nr:RNA 2',3'-cyclic phosphodiesterase [Nitrospirota bacterium]